MTIRTVEDYLNFLPAANTDKPLLRSAITAVIQDLVESNALVASIPGLYDIDVAVGSQLDVVGQWVGRSRNVDTPISGVYFSLDTDGVGFDQGYWQGPFDPATGVISLNDDIYRMFLYLQIAANQWDGSFARMQEILGGVFASASGSYLLVVDNYDMSITIGVAGVWPGAIILSLLDSYLAITPAAIGIKELVQTSVNGAPLFGFDKQNEYVSGFDTGAFGVAY